MTKTSTSDKLQSLQRGRPVSRARYRSELEHITTDMHGIDHMNCSLYGHQAVLPLYRFRFEFGTVLAL